MASSLDDCFRRPLFIRPRRHGNGWAQGVALWVLWGTETPPSPLVRAGHNFLAINAISRLISRIARAQAGETSRLQSQTGHGKGQLSPLLILRARRGSSGTGSDKGDEPPPPRWNPPSRRLQLQYTEQEQ
ncbi:hypothetical protein AAFF_G00225030 [Aldrovandia affinis]|uniref:Uncharacterized protein n=1 Tax=Aldrovandia affinis TaxID=143900 RepID=A0AAD7X298_9TELE|nr:hypothetical protein AAFF_G00225030 [Aldrovandia affinis]